jgi:phosphatidylglycerophosphate synthase
MAETRTAAAHVREHRSLLAAPEKRLLTWIARRLPRWLNSDHLSALGLGSMLVAGAAFAAFRLTPWAGVAVIACLAANWFGDSLDGTVARVRGHQRPRYGFYLDHVIDVAGTTCLMAGLACSAVMSPLIALAVLGAYLLVSAESYLATHAAGIFRISFVGVGPTELRVLLAIGIVKIMNEPWVTVMGTGPFLLFDIGGAVAAIGLIIAFMVSAVRNARALYIAEPLAASTRGTRAA